MAESIEPHPLRAEIETALTGALQGQEAMHCTRTWDGWTYGTMSEDDFSLVVDDAEAVAEIVDAVAQIVPIPLDRDQLAKIIYDKNPALQPWDGEAFWLEEAMDSPQAILAYEQADAVLESARPIAAPEETHA